MLLSASHKNQWIVGPHGYARKYEAMKSRGQICVLRGATRHQLHRLFGEKQEGCVVWESQAALTAPDHYGQCGLWLSHGQFVG